MITNLKQKTVFLSGATSGIGRAIAKSLLEQGASVVGVGRSESPFDQFDNYFHEFIDYSQLESLPARLKEISAKYDQINTLIHCAGGGQFGSIEEFSFDQIEALIRLNLTSHIYVTKHFMPHLRKQSTSDIVFIGSEAAISGGRRGAVYCASKFGLRGLSQALRDECAKSGVRVSLINPGMVKTPFFDELKFRPGSDPQNYIEAEDVAEAVNMVLSSRPGTVFDEICLSPLKKVIEFLPKT